MLALSPFALRLVKASFNAHEDGYAGIQQLAHDANLLFYGSEEAREGREAFKQRRQPDFSKFPTPAMRIWVMAARPRTLPAAIAPVLVGTAAAVQWVGHLPRPAPSSPPWSARSSSRSGPTSPTTTPTPSAAPTPPTGSGRCGSPRPGW